MSTKQDLKAGSPTVAVGGGVAPRRRSSSKMAGHDNPLQASPGKEDEKGGTFSKYFTILLLKIKVTII